jgi:hypothetical protein
LERDERAGAPWTPTQTARTQPILPSDGPFFTTWQSTRKFLEPESQGLQLTLEREQFRERQPRHQEPAMKDKLFNSIVLAVITSIGIAVAGAAGYVGLSTSSSYTLTSYFIQSGGLIADSDYWSPSTPHSSLRASAPASREDSSSF